MAYGLVFGGGGVRGAYHIGVWKALSEMKIPVCAVCGSSIGAINAALFVGSDLETAEKIWNEIKLEDVVSLDTPDFSEDLFNIKNIIKLAKEFRHSKGLEMKPLADILRASIDEERVFSSPVELGLVTYNITEKKECPIYKSQIPRGSLVDYLMASACLPGFKSVVIDNNKYLDGCITNTIPVNILTDIGIRDIIAVDVKGIGIYKEFNTAGKNIISIECKKPHTGTMDFDRGGVKKSISEGYYDTLSAFGKIRGGTYYLQNDDYLVAKAKYSDEIIEGIFSAAKILDIDNLLIWDFDALTKETLKRYNQTELTSELVALLSKNNFEKIATLKDDSQRLCLLVRLLQKDGFDFIKSHADKFLGSYYKAASALLYFLER